MLNFDPNRVSIGKKPVTSETSNSAHKQRKELFFTGACIIVKMKDVSSFFIVKIFDAASVQLVIQPVLQTVDCLNCNYLQLFV